jgi:hypothetical protein
MAWDANGRWIPDPKEEMRITAGLLGRMFTGPGADTMRRISQPTTTDPVQQQVAPPDPTLEDASVEGRLTGLLGANSAYMQAARKGGIRTAARRGLLNSSIAAGAGEAAAIAAAAPIASQEASQIHARNQTRLEGHIQFGNATRLQAQQDSAAQARQAADIAAQLQRLNIQIVAEKDIAASSQANALTQTQINAHVNLIGNYMQAFGAMASNPEIPASTRNAYIAEMKAVISQGMGLSQALAGKAVQWGTMGGTGGGGGGAGMVSV